MGAAGPEQSGLEQSGPPLLAIRGLRKSFGATEVLRGIDLSIARRELVFIIGPSGSGKSTLLRCCNRLEEPSSGEIWFEGSNLLAPGTDLNAMRRRIGMVGRPVGRGTIVPAAPVGGDCDWSRRAETSHAHT